MEEHPGRAMQNELVLGLTRLAGGDDLLAAHLLRGVTDLTQRPQALAEVRTSQATMDELCGKISELLNAPGTIEAFEPAVASYVKAAETMTRWRRPSRVVQALLLTALFLSLALVAEGVIFAIELVARRAHFWRHHDIGVGLGCLWLAGPRGGARVFVC